MTIERGTAYALNHPHNLEPSTPTARQRQWAHALPAELSTFIGREDEIATVRQMLDTTRLLTLTGAGGVGKTRLALRVASNVQRQGPRPVVFVEFGSLGDPDLLPRTLASALGVKEQPGAPLLDALIQVLQSEALLLVLDNCERVIAASATLSNVLLRACPELRILATSREPLRVAGETVWRVPSLSLAEDAHPSFQKVAEAEAVQLFVERTQAHTPEFTLDEQNAAAVAQLCRRLDATPLAIELAAARMTILSVQQIAERLEHALTLLTHGMRGAPARQQTLRATIDWSYSLLSAAEQRLFERLSVFSGGWTLDAAEAICADATLQRAEVLDGLDGLATRSLIIREPQVDGAHRFRLLETLRQYAREKLTGRDEHATFRQRHAEVFMALAERLQPDLLGHGARIALDQLEHEHDNLRASLQWFVDRSNAQAALRLAGTLGRFWQMRCHFAEGQEWTKRALALSGADQRTPERARCLYGLGNLTSGRGDLAAAEAANREALAIWTELRDAAGEAWTLYSLGQNAWRCGDYALAKDFLEQAVGRSRAVGLVPAETNALFRLADVALDTGDHAEAERRAEETIARATAAGWAPAAALAHRVLGEIYLARGETVAATQQFWATLAIARELGNDLVSATALLCLGQQALQRDDLGGAAQHLSEALQLGWSVGDQATIAKGLEAIGALAVAGGHTATGLQLAGAADTVRGASQAHRSAREQHWLGTYLRRAGAVLGGSHAERARRAGALLSAARAVDLALQFRLDAPDNDSDNLTARERQVAHLVSRGLSNPQIARELMIGERTAQTHVGNILGKLGLDSRVQIATWVTEHRLTAIPAPTQNP